LGRKVTLREAYPPDQSDPDRQPTEGKHPTSIGTRRTKAFQVEWEQLEFLSRLSRHFAKCSTLWSSHLHTYRQ